MLNKLLSMIRRYDMLQPGDRVICAVSGGADSVALLLGMYLLREKLEINLEAAHFNHNLRGEESERDAEFVKALCEQYDVPLHMGTGKVVAGKKGLEAAARDARYAFFRTLDGKIATAHTADDNAETLMMHLVRGTGLKGLGGITPVRENLIRPMLQVTRADVLEFLTEYHQPFVEDSSNKTDAFLRNRLRHHVMPLLRQENPRLSENLSDMAMRLRLDEEALNQKVDASKGLDVEKLKDMHPAIRSRVIDGFLKDAGVKEPDAANIALAEKLIFSAKPSAKAEFPGGVTVSRQYQKLVSISKKEALTTIPVQCPGITDVPQLGLRICCENAASVINNESVFTVQSVGQILLRGRMSGDAMTLSGGTKSLKKLFIDRKIPADSRDRIPVLSDNEGVLGVYGVGVNLQRRAQQLPAVQIRIEQMEPEREK